MGIPTPRPPLPRSATREEVIADLRRIQREIVEAQIMTAVTLIFGAVAAGALVLMVP